MQRSEDRILTTHVGNLHQPTELMALQVAHWMGESDDEDALREGLRDGVADIVARQVGVGLDVINDGEYSKTAYMDYIVQRVSGITRETVESDWMSTDGEFADSKDFHDFRAFYTEAGDQMTYTEPGPEAKGRQWLMNQKTTCVGPLVYTGQAQLERDIANLRAAVDRTGVEEAFLSVVAPGSVQPWMHNEHYPDDDAFFAAIAEVLRVEYRAIIEAGFILQIDDAEIVHEWDNHLLRPDWTLERYREGANRAVEALNWALEGLPEDRIRYHVCWGSWNGPHSTDIPLKDVVDLILKVKAQGYLIEAANARHEWEWRVWEDVALPEGKILIPGVIEHTTHVVEHPETVADRILRFTNVVGRENVIAGTDCGFRLRSHPQIAWAKLQALTEGARLASERLWRAG